MLRIPFAKVNYAASVRMCTFRIQSFYNNALKHEQRLTKPKKYINFTFYMNYFNLDQIKYKLIKNILHQ